MGQERTFARRQREALNPSREPLAVLEGLRRSMGVYNFAGQYQQNPAPAAGGLVEAKWFRFYTPDQLPDPFDQIVQSWDTAKLKDPLRHILE